MTKITLAADIGQAHDGSLGILHSYIDALSKTGIDIIKFQTHIAEAESSKFESFRTNFSYVDQSRFDYWKRMSFTLNEWKEIKKHCEDVGLEFMSSPFSIAAVEILEAIGVKRYKIGSGEVNNHLMLDLIGRTKKPVILSSGMSSFAELDESIQILKPYGNDITVLQCTTEYPTPPEKWGLNIISELKQRFTDLAIGYSDHSGNTSAGIAAAALGAEFIEFHAVFDKKMFGPDSSSSLNIDEIKDLVEAVRMIERSHDNPVNKNSTESFASLRELFGKSLAANKDLPKGHTIMLEDLESKKPYGKGIPAKNYLSVIGKKLKRQMLKYDFLNNEDLE